MSTSASFNGQQVIEMTYVHPTSGAPHAVFQVQSTDITRTWTVGTKSKLEIDSMSIVGTLRSVDSTSLHGRTQCVMYAGAGGMSVPGLLKNYPSQVTASKVFNDILKVAGETASSESDAGLLNLLMDQYELSDSDTCGQQLTDLCCKLLDNSGKVAGATWTCDSSGAIKVYVPQRKQIDLPAEALVQKQYSPGAVTYFFPALDKTPVPGTTNNGRNVDEVMITATSSKLRLTLLDTSTTVLNDASELFFGIYEGTVITDNSNDSFDVFVDDARLRGKGMVRVKATYGMPGMHCEVNSGARCSIAFMGGDPSKPRIVQWASQTNLKKMVIGDKTKARGVARNSDGVIVYVPGPVPFTGTVSGNPIAGTILFTPMMQLSGLIMTNSTVLECE